MAAKNVHRRVIKDITEGRHNLMEQYGIYLEPEESNMYNVHFVMPGPDESPFEGGLYHGMIRLNPSHPMLPPNVYMFTSSGRFIPEAYPIDKDSRGICFHYTAWHPEMWTPVNDIYKIVIGFISFMLDLKDHGAGCVEKPTEENIKRLTKRSLTEIKKDVVVRNLFPELHEQVSNDAYVPIKMGDLNKKSKVEKAPKPPPNKSKTKPKKEEESDEEESDEEESEEEEEEGSAEEEEGSAEEEEGSAEEESEEEKPKKKTKTPVKKEVSAKKSSKKNPKTPGKKEVPVKKSSKKNSKKS